jgi:hypothetical protein
MKYIKEKRQIILDRDLSQLDKFVLDFCTILDEYVLVSGYVSILFGRSRATEDVDLLIPPMSFDAFKKFWKKAYEKGFECLNTSKKEEAFERCLKNIISFF